MMDRADAMRTRKTLWILSLKCSASTGNRPASEQFEVTVPWLQPVNPGTFSDRTITSKQMMRPFFGSHCFCVVGMTR